MELPEDLLDLVRAFARPLLRYPDEYRNAMNTLDLGEWSLLKQHLSATDADKVLPVMKNYVTSFVARKNAYNTYDRYEFRPSDPSCPFHDLQNRWEELNRLRLIYRDSLRLQEVSYRKLMIQLGEETVQELVYTELDDHADY